MVGTERLGKAFRYSSRSALIDPSQEKDFTTAQTVEQPRDWNSRLVKGLAVAAVGLQGLMARRLGAIRLLIS